MLHSRLLCARKRGGAGLGRQDSCQGIGKEGGPAGPASLACFLFAPVKDVCSLHPFPTWPEGTWLCRCVHTCTHRTLQQVSQSQVPFSVYQDPALHSIVQLSSIAGTQAHRPWPCLPQSSHSPCQCTPIPMEHTARPHSSHTCTRLVTQMLKTSGFCAVVTHTQWRVTVCSAAHICRIMLQPLLGI